MAEKEVWIGSTGPFIFDDTETYEEDGSGETYRGIRTNKIYLDDTPTEDGEVIRLEDLNRVLLTPLEVTDIDDPSTELNAIEGSLSTMLLVYEVEATADVFTIYVWDDTNSAGEDVPYVVDGSTGYWIAIGGKYNNFLTGVVLETLFNANTILKADSDDIPLALTVGASTIVGRKATGNIVALTKTETLAILNVEDGADVTDEDNVADAGAVVNSEATATAHDYAGGHADWVLSSTEGNTNILRVWNSDAAVNIIPPNVANKTYIICNKCGYNAVVKKSGGVGVTIATLRTAIVRRSGSGETDDYARVTPDVAYL